MSNMLSELPIDLKLEILSFLPSLPRQSSQTYEIKTYYGKFVDDPTNQIYNIFNMYPRIKNEALLIQNQIQPILISGAERVEIDVTESVQPDWIEKMRYVRKINQLKKSTYVVGLPKSFMFIDNSLGYNLPSEFIMEIHNVYLKIIQAPRFSYPRVESIVEYLKSLSEQARKRVHVEFSINDDEILDAPKLELQLLQSLCKCKIHMSYDSRWTISSKNVKDTKVLAPYLKRVKIDKCSWKELNWILDHPRHIFRQCVHLTLKMHTLKDDGFLDHVTDIVKQFPSLEQITVSMNMDCFHSPSTFINFCSKVFLAVAQCDLKQICFENFVFDNIPHLVRDYNQISAYDIQRVSFQACTLQNFYQYSTIRGYLQNNIGEQECWPLFQIMDHFSKKVGLG